MLYAHASILRSGDESIHPAIYSLPKAERCVVCVQNEQCSKAGTCFGVYLDLGRDKNN